MKVCGGFQANARIEALGSSIVLHSGFLSKNAPVGLRLRWQKRWVAATRDSVRYFDFFDGDNKGSGPWSELKGEILIEDIQSVKPGVSGLFDEAFCFEITCTGTEREPYTFAAANDGARQGWIRKLSGLKEQYVSRQSRRVTRDSVSRAIHSAIGAGGGGGGGGRTSSAVASPSSPSAW